MECICEPEYVDGTRYSQFWGTYFGECLYSPRQHASMVLGLVSIVLYGVALAPQIYRTYRRKSVEGLSVGLFALWALGDMSNTVGAILTKQFTLQIWTGIYFLVTDVIVICQYQFYKSHRRIRSPEQDPLLQSGAYDDDRAQSLNSVASLSLLSAGLGLAAHSGSSAAVATSGRILRSSQGLAPLCNATSPLSPTATHVGQMVAWMSGLFYFFSRFPQIHTNYAAKSVEGISLSLFVITLSANVLYGVSVLLRVDEITTAKFYTSTLPYLIGSMGTLVSDAVVIYQAYLYRGNRTADEEVVSDADDNDA
ncbi:hypothetical protein RI367_000675 [Sorochytrium milnesiophthora]